MNRPLRIILLLGLAAGLNTSLAQAADSGFYGILSAGITKSDRKAESDRALEGAGATAYTSNFDDSDTGFKLQISYQLNKHLAIEGGHVNLGKLVYRSNITAPSVITGEITLNVDGWNLGVVGRLPFSQSVTGFAKLGAFAYTVDYSCTRTGGCVYPTRTVHGTTANYGVGLDFNFASSWFARVEYEVFARVGKSMNANGTDGTTREDFQFGSLGIGYRF